MSFSVLTGSSVWNPGVHSVCAFDLVTPVGSSSLLILLEDVDVCRVHTETLATGFQRNKQNHKLTRTKLSGG